MAHHYHPVDALGQISRHYGVTFPEPVRALLVQWIELRLGNAQQDLLLPAPIFEQNAHTFLHDFIAELVRIAQVHPPDYIQTQLSTAINILSQENPTHEPLVQLYTALLSNRQHRQPSIDDQIEALRTLVSQSEANIRSVFQNQMANETLTDELGVIVERATDLVNQILGLIIQWQIQQEQQRNEDALAAMLDSIQAQSTKLADLVWSVRDQVQAAVAIFGANEVTNRLHEQTLNLLSMLITKGFIIEKQPPRVLKTNVRYPVAVRHLLGDQLRGQMLNPVLTACIISEFHARSIQQSNTVGGANSGDVVCDDDGPKFNDEPQHLRANIRLQIRKIKRLERRNAESVTDEKFALLFHLALTVKDLAFSVWTISQPVVVIVHGNQEAQAWATIVWDNAFANIGRLPFDVSDRVSWNLLAEMLNRKFTSLTDRPLTASNLHFLGVKATRRSLPFPVTDDQLITRDDFCKLMIPARSFTFWEWFHAAMKVTQCYLKDIWNDGAMVGFIEKARAEQDLRQHQPGTFLLRFSDSQLGGITIAYVTSEPTRRIQHINPFVGRDAVNVINAIRDLPQLKYLYPGVPKAEAFERHFQPQVVPVAGYVPAVPADPAANGESNNQFVHSTILMLEAVLNELEPIDHIEQDLMQL